MREFEVICTVPETIRANFEAVEEDLRQMMTAYEGLEVSEETEKERKADLATLRKIKSALDAERKRVKAEYNKPLKSFEEKVKVLTGIIDKQIQSINTDLLTIDTQRIQKKREEERRLYDENIGEYVEFLPFEAIHKPQWDNKTYSEKAILTDIQEAVMGVKHDLQTIIAMQSEFEDEIIRTYKANGNSLVLAMQRESQMRSAMQMAEKKAAEAAQTASAPVPAQTQQDVPQNLTESRTEAHRYMFEVFNEEDYDLVMTYMQLNCIKYKEV